MHPHAVRDDGRCWGEVITARTLSHVEPMHTNNPRTELPTQAGATIAWALPSAAMGDEGIEPPTSRM